MRRSALLVVCLAVFVDMLGFGIILPLLPFEVERLGGSGAWVGALLTAYAAAQFVSAPILGALSDRYGRRPLLLFSLAGSTVSMALTGFAGSLWLLLIARVVAGAFGGSIAVGQAYAVDLAGPGGGRTRALGMVGASIGLGFVFGPAIGAAVSGFGFSGASFTSAAIAAVNLALAVMLLPTAATTSPSTPARRANSAIAALRHALQLPTLRPLLVAVFAITFAFTGMEATFALLGARRFGLGPAGLGLVFAGVGVVMVIVQGGLVGRVSDRYGDLPTAVAGALLLMLSLALLPFTPWWLAYGLLGLLAVGQGLLAPTTAALVAKAGGNERGSAFGVNQSAASAARAIGPLVAGALFDVRIAAPYLVGAALCAVAAGVLAGGGRAVVAILARTPSPATGQYRPGRRRSR